MKKKQKQQSAMITLGHLAELPAAKRAAILARLTPTDLIAARWSLRVELAKVERILDVAALDATLALAKTAGTR